MLHAQRASEGLINGCCADAGFVKLACELIKVGVFETRHEPRGPMMYGSHAITREVRPVSALRTQVRGEPQICEQPHGLGDVLRVEERGNHGVSRMDQPALLRVDEEGGKRRRRDGDGPAVPRFANRQLGTGRGVILKILI